MIDFRQRLEQSRNKPLNGETSVESPQGFECPYFATDRGQKPICLDLRLPEGSRIAIPYVYFAQINYDIEAGIEILTTQKRICITGRNLGKLYDYLIAYRVRFIQVDIGMDMGEDGVFVQEITIDEILI